MFRFFVAAWNGLRDICCELGEATIEIIHDIIYFLSRTIYFWSVLIEFACPYLMWDLVIYCYNIRGEFRIGGEVFVPIICIFISKVIKNIAVRKNVGNSIPVPRERFTKEVEEGEYSVEEERLQEMILYVADVEDYLERKGLIK